jgi:hypothetical protein
LPSWPSCFAAANARLLDDVEVCHAKYQLAHEEEPVCTVFVSHGSEAAPANSMLALEILVLSALRSATIRTLAFDLALARTIRPLF